MSVSIVTLTYNKSDMLADLARGMIQFCDQHVIQWVVVDNGQDDSEDALREVMRHRTNQNLTVTYLRHDNSGNFSSMNNAAVKACRHPYVIFLNNDVVPQSDFVGLMTTLLREDETIGIVGAVLRYPMVKAAASAADVIMAGKMQHCGVVIGNEVTPGNLGDRAASVLKLHPDAINPGRWHGLLRFQAVTGACLAMRTGEFVGLGGFHEEFSWAFEDVDLCFRMRTYLAKHCVVDPNTYLTHAESASGGDRAVDLNLEILRGRWKSVVRPDHALFRHPDLMRRLIHPYSARAPVPCLEARE